MGQELVEDLEKTITRKEANKYPPPGSKEDAWMMKVLERATKVLCLAKEACDKYTKGDWQPCTYQRYRWRMDQEVGHLYALFGGPEEDEVRVKGQRLAKAWLAKAHDSVKGAREHMGLQLRRASKPNVARQCQHDGLPAESRPCEEQAQAAIQRADFAWEGGPRRMRELCSEYPDTAGWPTRGTMPGGRQAAALSSLQALRTTRATRTLPSPAIRIPPTPRQRTPVHQGPRQRTPPRLTWKCGGGARSHPTRAAQIPPPPTRKSRTRPVPTPVLRSHAHPTPRERSFLPHHSRRRSRKSGEWWPG
jgi:hypothetical protein